MLCMAFLAASGICWVRGDNVAYRANIGVRIGSITDTRIAATANPFALRIRYSQRLAERGNEDS